ncbi:MAG: hydrolase [Patescibacteria group bacterium]|jgi:hypothetical protein
MAQEVVQQQNPQSNEPEYCYCPPIIDSEWDEREIDWTGKQFFRATYRAWLYSPREDLSVKIINAYKEIAKRGYGFIPNGLHLYRGGMFRGEILIEIKNGHMDDPEVKTFMGYVYSKIYIGPLADLPKVSKTFNFKALNIYTIHFSCPVCTPDPNLQKTVLIGEKRFY